VKRVIGLPGDTVDIHDGAVWINGQKLVEKYTTGASEAYDQHMPFKVPADCYFVMGDNRGKFLMTAAFGLRSAKRHHRNPCPDFTCR